MTNTLQATEQKPCAACPWTQKGQPDLTDELREARLNRALTRAINKAKAAP